MKHSLFMPITATLATLIFFMPIAGLRVSAAGTEVDHGTTQANVIFTGGDLKLAQVPVLDFGTQVISDDEQSYPATNISAPIQVSDLRGSGMGWELTVTLSPFATQTGSKPTLRASEIRVAKPTVTGENGNQGTAPETSDLVLTSDNTVVSVWSASEDEGMGIWNMTWSTDDTQLVVKPGTARSGASSATLTWSLQTAP